MTTTTAVRDRWVVCADYTAGPYTAQQAPGVLAGIERLAAKAAPAAIVCPLPHHIVTSAAKPAPSAPAGPDVPALYAAWSEPFLADPSDEHASAARTAETRALAAAILAADVGGQVGPMTIVSAGWSRERGALADSLAAPGSAAWRIALGTHERATLTADGRSAGDAWCGCQPEPGAAGWVPYERWTADGRVAHGFVCPECRRITQTG